MIYVLDDEWKQTWEAIKKTELTGWVNISLEAEGIFWTNEELKHKKLIELYNTLAPSGFFESPDMAKEIMKTAWYSPSRFITEPWEWPKPDNADKIAAGNAQTNLPWKNASEDDANALWDALWAASTPNTNLGNWGQWNPNT